MTKEKLSEFSEFAKKFQIDFKKLEQEQLKLSKQVVKKDEIKADSVSLIAGCDTTSFENKIIAAISVIDRELNVVEEQFSVRKASFPYIPGFLAYRELPALLECYYKLQNQTDIFMIDGNGILHPRRFGLACHFGVSVNKPTIGVSKELLCGSVKSGKVYNKKEIIGEELHSKPGANPIYVSIGHKISLKTAVKLVKKTTREPHKLPEPIVRAHKYANQIKKEMFGV